MASRSKAQNPFFHPLLFLYQVLQWLLDKLLSPKPPRPNETLCRPKVAVIGAGITGVTSAAHCVGHGFDVVIFEAGSSDKLGGIWSRVNDTSGLQIHSLMYRFHPSVQWERGYPDRQQIISQVRQLWKRYGLQDRTKFDTKVETIYSDNQGRWIVNNRSLGHFDGVIVAIGTCGAPKMPHIQGMEKFKGDICHSTQLTGLRLLRKLFYRDLEDLAPTDKGIFTDTPMVNSDVMHKLREGKAEWIRCDIEEFTERGIVVNRRAKGVPKDGPGHQETVDADIVVMATGFKRPSLSILPEDCFKEPYSPPNWYLQTFPPSHPSISAINCTYLTAIGTVGNWHIGIYTRILLMFLVDPLTRPSPWWMQRWIDMTKALKKSSPTGAFDFFTYLELVWWFVFCVAFNPFRWKWAVFVFFGVGLGLPAAVVRQEERVMRNGNSYPMRDHGASV